MNEEELNKHFKQSTEYEVLKEGLLEIFNLKGIDAEIRDRRIRFLLHYIGILEDKDLAFMEKYERHD